LVKEDVWRMISQLAQALNSQVSDPALAASFNRAWPELQEKIKPHKGSAPTPLPAPRQLEMIGEILEIARELKRANIIERAYSAQQIVEWNGTHMTIGGAELPRAVLSNSESPKGFQPTTSPTTGSIVFAHPVAAVTPSLDEALGRVPLKHKPPR
jgi:hypothetical protein